MVDLTQEGSPPRPSLAEQPVGDSAGGAAASSRGAGLTLLGSLQVRATSRGLLRMAERPAQSRKLLPPAPRRADDEGGTPLPQSKLPNRHHLPDRGVRCLVHCPLRWR